MKIKTILASVSLLAGTAVPIWAQDDAGAREYTVACAVCHGESGMGSGPMAEHLSIEVPSLTTLAARNDGVFPFLDVFMVIDGRTGVRGHGTSAMPVWGERYATGMEETVGSYGTEIQVRGRLLSLVYYLESIQE